MVFIQFYDSQRVFKPVPFWALLMYRLKILKVRTYPFFKSERFIEITLIEKIDKIIV